LANRPDRKTAQGVGELLRDLHAREKTILIVVTHSPDLARQFPRQVEMIEGTLQDGVIR